MFYDAGQMTGDWREPWTQFFERAFVELRQRNPAKATLLEDVYSIILSDLREGVMKDPVMVGWLMEDLLDAYDH